MTSDAKIGLLLGLVFIFIIAFIINGLPGLGKNTDSNELTSTYIKNLKTDSLDIANKTRKAAVKINYTASADRDNVRFSIPLPKTAPQAASPARKEVTPAAVKTVKILTGPKTQIQKNKKYIVRDGDSLWKIAEEQLGSGDRYYEIIKLNRSIISDEDVLAVGMVLRIPER